ncbi:hypothetical protein ADUPG1_006592 [Aduncisulcus paluster]|uniref:FAD synthase n=1 Tax=Aduncisulcus paluster TaxID=2918883 RepID=A0ABQ5KLQ7_9EUKA|nr:hypothetical protein ADUPG1_006592 [Aduncisulcus paluster]
MSLSLTLILLFALLLFGASIISCDMISHCSSYCVLPNFDFDSSLKLFSSSSNFNSLVSPNPYSCSDISHCDTKISHSSPFDKFCAIEPDKFYCFPQDEDAVSKHTIPAISLKDIRDPKSIYSSNDPLICEKSTKKIFSLPKPSISPFLSPSHLFHHSSSEHLEDCSAMASLALYGESELAIRMRESLGVIFSAMEKYKRVAFSFNGGKDCTVLLHLLRTAAFLRGYGFDHCETIDKDGKLVSPQVILRSDPSLSAAKQMTLAIPTFFLDISTEFDEIIEFMEHTISKFSLDIDKVSYPADSVVKKDGKVVPIDDIPIVERFKHLIEYYINIKDVDGVFLGVRATDMPSKHLSFFSSPSVSWPNVVRIIPLLNWSIIDIWEFLLRFDVPFCSLYSRGYTSLGSPGNTVKNANLSREAFYGAESPDTALRWRKDGNDEVFLDHVLIDRGLSPARVKDCYSDEDYLPAWCMPLSADERDSRK